MNQHDDNHALNQFTTPVEQFKFFNFYFRILKMNSLRNVELPPLVRAMTFIWGLNQF